MNCEIKSVNYVKLMVKLMGYNIPQNCFCGVMMLYIHTYHLITGGSSRETLKGNAQVVNYIILSSSVIMQKNKYPL